MDMDYVKMWLKSLIKEEINKDQLTSVSQALGVTEFELMNWIATTDPSPNQSFSVWLLRGLKKGWLHFEDTERIRPILERFIELRRINRIGDIMQYPQLNDLEDAVERLVGVGAKRQGYSGINPTTLNGVSVLQNNPEQNMIFFKVTDPISLGKMGEGTKWCTRYSYRNDYFIAQKYISEYGYLVIGYKDGKPFIQFNPDYTQVMDINDRSFEINKNIDPKTLNLPGPDFLKNPTLPPKNINSKNRRPVDTQNLPIGGYRYTLNPNQQTLKNWMKYTSQPVKPEWLDYINGAGRDLDYERRVATSLAKTDNHEFFARILSGFSDYADRELKPGERSAIVEKALLDKNLEVLKQNFGFTRTGKDGSLVREKRSGINGLNFIADYVMNNVGGHWPEFEKKLQNDPYNSMYYYNYTHLDPDYVTDPLLKEAVLIRKMINGEGFPSLDNEEFNAKMRDFIAKVREKWKYGSFSSVMHNILLPYLQRTNQTVQDVLGDKLAKQLVRSLVVGRKTEFWKNNKAE